MKPFHLLRLSGLDRRSHLPCVCPPEGKILFGLSKYPQYLLRRLSGQETLTQSAAQSMKIRIGFESLKRFAILIK